MHIRCSPFSLVLILFSANFNFSAPIFLAPSSRNDTSRARVAGNSEAIADIPSEVHFVSAFESISISTRTASSSTGLESSAACTMVVRDSVSSFIVFSGNTICQSSSATFDGIDEELDASSDELFEFVALSLCLPASPGKTYPIDFCSSSSFHCSLSAELIC